MLFNMFISDIEKGVNNEVTRYTDDSKLFRVVRTRASSWSKKDLTR